MIERYTRAAMAKVWSQENRFAKMLEVEIAVSQVQAELGLIPATAAKEIAKKARFDVARIDEIEKTTKHDVIAFVSNLAENVGPAGRYIHFGLTSSDVLDTALSLLIQEAGDQLLDSVAQLKRSLRQQIKKHADTLCAGRTHGMHAEPTTFGMKLAGHLCELERDEDRLLVALEEMRIGKLSGAVGTYSTQTEEVERQVCERLELVPERIATQVIPRDRHAEVFFALAVLGAGLERLAVELRHLQRTEVGEVIEGFTPGQKGSSAMPHKKNPISSENITGCARLLRGYLGAAMEDIALWHERDISHSSVERVIFPDAFILADYACERMARVLDGLYVNKERMRANMDLSMGQLFSSHLLLALVEKGLSREEAYALVQGLAHHLQNGETLREVALKNKKIKSLLRTKDVEAVFSGIRHREAIADVLKRAHVLRPPNGQKERNQ
jgi:adenylosuccinate lyase